MTIGEHIDRENPQYCLICGQIVSVARDWPICPVCKFNQTSPEAYAIRKARGLLWRSGLSDEGAAADSPSDERPLNDRTNLSELPLPTGDN